VLVMPAALATLLAMPLGLEAAPLWIMGWGIDAMVWCAAWVAGLPGAVGRVTAIPTAAFVLLVLGGLWCCLWSTRWRLLGIVPIAAGLALTPTGRKPDVLVGRAAGLVAVRTTTGELSALPERGSTFELARWLEHDGDGRTPAEVAKAAAFRCDAHGCTTRVQGRLLAVAFSPVALRDDCARAAILVVRFARPDGCTPAGPVVDVDAAARLGAHTLYIDADRIRIDTVAAARGDRPWSARPAPLAPARETVEEDWSARDRRFH